MIRLRFMTGNDQLSKLIRFQAGISMPFTPSHVECLTPDGKDYIGQHIDGGMQARPVGYDANSTLAEKIVELPCSQVQEDAFYAFMRAKIGDPYDWKSIISFAAPNFNFHSAETSICSAIQTLGLRTKGCEYFPMPLTVPAHHISPRDLMLILSSHVQIDH